MINWASLAREVSPSTLDAYRRAVEMTPQQLEAEIAAQAALMDDEHIAAYERQISDPLFV